MERSVPEESAWLPQARQGNTDALRQLYDSYQSAVTRLCYRLLERWAASRRRNGTLTAKDYIEIAQLTDRQLDSDTIAAGAMACFGLLEWEIGRTHNLRDHWRFLGQFSPTSRQAALSEKELAFEQLPLGQRHQFATLAFGSDAEKLRLDLEDMMGATLRVEVDPPGTVRHGEDARSFPYAANPIRFVYARKDRWSCIHGPFNATLHLPRWPHQ